MQLPFFLTARREKNCIDTKARACLQARVFNGSNPIAGRGVWAIKMPTLAVLPQGVLWTVLWHERQYRAVTLRGVGSRTSARQSATVFCSGFAAFSATNSSPGFSLFRDLFLETTNSSEACGPSSPRSSASATPTERVCAQLYHVHRQPCSASRSASSTFWFLRFDSGAWFCWSRSAPSFWNWSGDRKTSSPLALQPRSCWSLRASAPSTPGSNPSFVWLTPWSELLWARRAPGLRWRWPATSQVKRRHPNKPTKEASGEGNSHKLAANEQGSMRDVFRKRKSPPKAASHLLVGKPARHDGVRREFK